MNYIFYEYGQLNEILKKFIIERFGENRWDVIA